jgi:hypothetical protein
MFNRFALSIAALTLFAAAPAFANSVHASRGASQQGVSTDANFDAPTTANGIPVTPFFNVNDSVDPLLEIFQIPSNFTSGTSYTLTFTNLAAGYGVFDCNNPNNPNANFAISADSTPVTLNGPCTAEAEGASDPFITYNEVGNTATITFTGSSSTTFYFWTTASEGTNGSLIGNLTSITAVNNTVPEPATYAMLGAGLLMLTLMRRRTANA